MRLALYGGIGTPRGDYSGKTPQPEPEVVADTAATGGWLTDPYGYETRRRAALKRDEDEARKQADEAIERAQEVAKAALQAKKSAKKPESPALNLAEASRLIDALEAAQSKDRRRRLAAVLLLMA